MKLDSKYFDMIRIHRSEAEPEKRNDEPCCEWAGCPQPGRYRAPRNRDLGGAFYLFCVDHVRQYNASYNYFDGMSDAEVVNFQKSATYGHRPTWKVGANAWQHGTRHGVTEADLRRFATSRNAGAQSFHAWRAKQTRKDGWAPRRQLKPLERKAMRTLGLDDTADKVAIKTRFKELVKRHHPDLNEGHRGSEDTLREIIQAYNYLKQAGLV